MRNKRAENYDVGTLENKVVVEAESAQNQLENIISTLNKMASCMVGISGCLKEINKESVKTSSANTGLRSIANELSNASYKATLFKNTLKWSAITAGIYQLVNLTKDMATNYIDMVETNNLFEVAMGRVEDEYGNLDRISSRYYLKAIKFQDEMNEKLATNKTEMKKYQAMYYSMLTSQGIDKDKSYIMSESLTKAGYDIASLFNLEVDKAMSKLQSGLSGQPKALRELGIDISASSLETLLGELGIDRSVEQLSYAEKEVARYIAILQQAGKAQGDFAKTFENPANQIKVFKNQLIELKQVAGSFIVNTFGGILVYVNGIIMAIKEILKFFATLFGYNLSSGGAINLNDATGAEDLASNLGTASGNAKKLKNILMGFDEINNITLPDSSGSGGGSATNGGIDQKLLDAIGEWDNKMDSISGKAQQIRDWFLKIFGFTKDITGKLSWAWKNMNGWVQVIIGLISIITAIKIIGRIAKLITWLGTLWKIFKTGEGAVTTFGLGMQTIGKLLKSGIGHIKDYITFYKVLKAEGISTSGALVGSFKEVWASISTGTKLIIGTGGLVASCVLAYKSMQDLSDGVISSDEAFLKLTGSMAGAIASGAMIGSVFGGVGALIGGIVGAVIDLGIAFAGIKTEADKSLDVAKEHTKAINEYIKSIKDEKQAIQENVDSQLAIIGYHESLTAELDELVDANGRVKDGYEERVNFILNQLNEAYNTEYKAVDGIIENYKGLKQEVYDLMEAKKAEIVLNANQESYEEALKRRIKNQSLRREEQEKLNSATENYNGILREIETKYGSLEEAEKKLATEGGGWTFNHELGTLLSNFYKAEEETNKYIENIGNLASQIKEDNELIILWDDLKTATIAGNNDEIISKMQELSSYYETETGRQKATLVDQISAEIDMANDRKRIWEEAGIEINEERKRQLEVGIRTLIEKLNEATKTVQDLTPENVEAWRLIGSSSYDVYSEELSKMSPELKAEIQKMTGIYIEMTPELERVVEDMSSKMVDRLDKEPEMKKTAIDNIKQYLQGLEEPEQRRLLELAGIENTNKVIEGLKKGNLSEDVGINILKGLNTGLANGRWQGVNLATASTFATNLLNKFKRTFGIASPSKETRKFGIYLLEGLGIGIESEENNVLKTVEDFSNELLKNMDNSLNNFNGIQVSAKDASIDATSYVDYGAVSGDIKAQSNVAVSNDIVQGIAQAVSRAMQQNPLNVNIEARTEEGVIVERASEGFRQYVRQTGELPFPVPIN